MSKVIYERKQQGSITQRPKLISTHDLPLAVKDELKVKLNLQISVNVFFSYLVDSLRGFDLDLRGRRVDRVRNVRFERDQQATPVGDPLAQSVIQVGMLVDEAVVTCRAVEMDEGRPEGRDEA